MLTVDELLRGARPAADLAHNPLAHLTACHRRVEQRLATLARAAEAWNERPAEALAAIDSALGFFSTSGVLHTEDEEASVFPRLVPKLDARERAVVDSLQQEHVEAAQLHAELERLARQLRAAASLENLAALASCVKQLTAVYQRHIETEDTQIAELIRSRLDAAELHQISVEMQQRRQTGTAK